MLTIAYCDRRRAQISTLWQYFSKVTEKIPNQEYELEMNVPVRGGPASQLRPLIASIELPTDFPNRPPRIVLRNETHRFIDHTNFTLLPSVHPKLQQWIMHHSLGQVLYEIYQTVFKPDPPTPVFSASSAAPSKPTYSYPPTAIQPSPRINAAAISPSPSLPATFPEIEAKSMAEVKELLDADDAKFQAFFNSLDVVATFKTVPEQVAKTNLERTEANIQLSTEIDEANLKLTNARLELETLRHAFNQKYQQQQLIQKRLAPETLVGRLSEGIQAADTESDTLASVFLDGGIDCKDFIEQYLARRKVFHMRSLKKADLMTNPRPVGGPKTGPPR